MMFPPRIRALTLLALFAATFVSARTRPHARTHEVATQNTSSSAQSVQALFVESDISRARRLADATFSTKLARRATASHLDALFVSMEAAALQADVPAELEAAMRLCEASGADADPRVSIAANRLLDHAGNTVWFRPLVPRISAVLAAGSAQSSLLKAALLTAANDGVSGLSVSDLAHASGLITDWTVAGPFGKYSNLSFDRQWPPENDSLTRHVYSGYAVERFRFNNGTFELPDYLAASGVLYAAAEVSVATAGQYRVRVESPGTIQVFVDGVPAITKDDRLRATPEVVANTVRLGPGSHRLLAKFLASAAPFRVALLPLPPSRPSAVHGMASPKEAAYVSAARDYWDGDYNAAVAQLTKLRDQHRSAVVDMMLAKAWQQTDRTSPEPKVLTQEALNISSDCIAAELALAEDAIERKQVEDAAAASKRILGKVPDSEQALLVLAASASHLGWDADATKAYARLAALHPSCNLLRQALTFATSASDFAAAKAFDSQLATCAPGSLLWADNLGKRGDHVRAAEALQAIVSGSPLDRTARELLIRELSLAGRRADAIVASEDLTRIAPGSARYRSMRDALRRGDHPESGDSRLTGFAGTKQFYADYRRDSFGVLKQTADRHFSGGPAVTLLHDRVAQLTSDGHVSLYVHKITRILNRDGILQYGEVALPTGAGVLELRTIKTDGAVAEPELTQHKATISMPALAPGDAIDVEYVLRYREGGFDEHADAFEFTFGSFAAPILLSRFVVLSPADANLQFVASGDVPGVKVRDDSIQIAREWERNDIAQSVSEIAMPKAGLLPSIRVLDEQSEGWTAVRDAFRDALIDSVRIGSNVNSAAAAIATGTDEAKVRAAYRFVTTRVRQTSALFGPNASSAENTLSAYAGSRTAVLVALARALGVRADVVMARDAAVPKPQAVSPDAYTRPLVLLRLRDGALTKELLLDAETEGVGFGGIAPTIARSDAILVSIDQADEARVLVSVPAPTLDDRSTAVADVSFDEQGNLSANLEIRMGAARSAQMRSILSGIENVNRKHFFEQLATRIFPGAADASGEVRNEFDPDHPLELVVRCRAPRFANFGANAVEIDQLAPALGLRKLYAAGGSRREPLFIDTPLIENATFRVRVPETMRFTMVPAGMAEENQFGSYAVTFLLQAPTLVEVRRDFRIPVQTVEPGNFDAFSRFARRIDDAERQRLTIERLSQVSLAATH